jgi:hypothetical protein
MLSGVVLILNMQWIGNDGEYRTESEVLFFQLCEKYQPKQCPDASYVTRK